MNPIPNQQFNHDYPKFVYQDPDVRFVTGYQPIKKFSINGPDKASKTKKDLKKQKNLFSSDRDEQNEKAE